MEETYLLNLEGVKKKILHGGRGQLPDFIDGSKITFHFQTLKDDFERTVIDDSWVGGIPMEIIVGKMFKIEVWEALLTSMRIGEVAEFWCDAVHTGMYALVSKGMRKIAEGKDPLEGQKHRCGMGNMFDYHSTGYEDLNELLKTPQPLIFIMELFKVEDPSTYKRDTWAMNNEEKLKAVPKLHHEGNRLVLSRKFKEAAEKYQEAVICLRNVQAKEKPWDEDWLRLEKLITPLVLNYCQCQLELGEYYEVLEHTTDLLQKDNENVKAYFKRAKAHAAVWNEKEARIDFQRVAQLDPSLAAAVRKELKILGERMRKKHVEDRKRYKGIFQEPVSKGETEEESQGLSEEKEEPPGNGIRTQEEASKEETPKPEGRQEVGNRETEGGMEEEENIGLVSMCREETAPQKEVVIGTGERVHGHGRDSGQSETGGDSSGPKEQSGVEQQRLAEEREEINSVAEAPNGVVGCAVLEGEQDERVGYGGSGKEAGEVAGDARISMVEGLAQVHCETKGNLEGEDPAREWEDQEGEFKALLPVRMEEEMGTETKMPKEEAQVVKSEGDIAKDCFQVQQKRSEGEAGVVTELDLRAETLETGEHEGPREQSPPGGKEEEMKLERTKTEADAASEPEGEQHEAGPRHDEMEERGVGAGNCSVEAEMSPEAENSRGEESDLEEEARCGKKEIQAGCTSKASKETQRDKVGPERVGAETSFRSENSTADRSDEDSEVEHEEGDGQVHGEGPDTLGGRAELTKVPLSTQRSIDRPREEHGEKQGMMSPMHCKEGEDQHQACFLVQVTESVVSCEKNTCTMRQPVPTEEEADGEEKCIK